MKVISSLGEFDRPQAPEGYRYSFTQSWDTNRTHVIPGTASVHKIILDKDGKQVAEGEGMVEVNMDLPATVHVYTEQNPIEKLNEEARLRAQANRV